MREEFRKTDSLDNFQDFDESIKEDNLSQAQRIERDIYLIKDLSKFQLQYSNEEILFVFCGFMRYCNLRKIFEPGMVKVQEASENYKEKFRKQMPDLHHKMCGNDVSAYALNHNLLDLHANLRHAILSHNLHARDSNQIQW